MFNSTVLFRFGMQVAQPSVLARQSLRRVRQVGAVRVRAMSSNGKVALITGAHAPVERFCGAPDSSAGASAGLGKVSALELSRKGYTVVGACRSLEKGSAVAEQIAKQGGSMEVMQLDLADLASVRLFAREFLAKHPRCDVLLNNAGVMAPPTRQQTVDGFELQARRHQVRSSPGAGRPAHWSLCT